MMNFHYKRCAVCCVCVSVLAAATGSGGSDVEDVAAGTIKAQLLSSSRIQFL